MTCRPRGPARKGGRRASSHYADVRATLTVVARNGDRDSASTTVEVLPRGPTGWRTPFSPARRIRRPTDPTRSPERHRAWQRRLRLLDIRRAQCLRLRGSLGKLGDPLPAHGRLGQLARKRLRAGDGERPERPLRRLLLRRRAGDQGQARGPDQPDDPARHPLLRTQSPGRARRGRIPQRNPRARGARQRHPAQRARRER